jgi:hypothetical protein
VSYPPSAPRPILSSAKAAVKLPPRIRIRRGRRLNLNLRSTFVYPLSLGRGHDSPAVPPRKPRLPAFVLIGRRDLNSGPLVPQTDSRLWHRVATDGTSGISRDFEVRTSILAAVFHGLVFGRMGAEWVQTANGSVQRRDTERETALRWHHSSR